MATVLSGSYTDFVEAFLCRDNNVYNLVPVVFVESVTGAVHRLFHILGHSIFDQSRSMRILGGFVSVFIRMTIVSYMRCLYVCTVSVLPYGTM